MMIQASLDVQIAEDGRFHRFARHIRRKNGPNCLPPAQGRLYPGGWVSGRPYVGLFEKKHNCPMSTLAGNADTWGGRNRPWLVWPLDMYH